MADRSKINNEFNKNNVTKVRLFCEYEKFMKKRL